MYKVVQRGLKYVIWSVSLLQEKAAGFLPPIGGTADLPRLLWPWGHGVHGSLPLPAARLWFLDVSLCLIRVCVLLRMTR